MIPATALATVGVFAVMGVALVAVFRAERPLAGHDWGDRARLLAGVAPLTLLVTAVPAGVGWLAVSGSAPHNVFLVGFGMGGFTVALYQHASQVLPDRVIETLTMEDAV